MSVSMKIEFSKSTKKGFSGSKTFYLCPKLTVTDQEMHLIEKYDINSVVLVHLQKLNHRGESIDEYKSMIYVGNLLSGKNTYKSSDIREMLFDQQQIVKACQELKILLEAATSFDEVDETPSVI